MCLEMGLHRRKMIERRFPDPESRLLAVQAFWSVYMFERRVSLGLGIPYYIHDSYLDPALFEMVSWVRCLPVSILADILSTDSI